jgi:hypothetical protein
VPFESIFIDLYCSDAEGAYLLDEVTPVHAFVDGFDRLVEALIDERVDLRVGVVGRRTSDMFVGVTDVYDTDCALAGPFTAPMVETSDRAGGFKNPPPLL